MRHVSGALFALLLLIGPLATAAAAWPGNERTRPHALEGGWRLVGTLAEDEDVIEPPARGFEEYKVVADGYFIWTAIQDGRVTGTAGGVARMGSRTYTERVDYASESRLAWIVGHRHAFQWSIRNGLWYHTGTLRGGGGMSARVAEVWERVR
ncbi:MAG: hypothetical protein ABIS67_04775 [Candidatus Eisenbacteria bacterium]